MIRSLNHPEQFDFSRLDRRSFLRNTVAGLPFLLASSNLILGRQQQHESFLSRLGKDSRMIVHNSRPGVLETPLQLLRTQRLTPKELLFVRNNQIFSGALSSESMDLRPWELELIGLIGGKRTVRGEDLLRLPSEEIEMVLQCSGTGRAYYSTIAKTRGTQWTRGGMGNVRWRGVPVRTLLDSLQLAIEKPVRFVAAEGKDEPLSPDGADFEHSLPIEDFLERALLAYELNGEPIPAIHGGPLRLVVPGFYGTMQIKWLTRLRFEQSESTNHHHRSRYRTFNDPITPGTSPTSTFENTSPTWNQRLKSIVWEPMEGQDVRSGKTRLAGVAWNDGRQSIQAVEVSLDEGRTWQKAELQKPESQFAWYHWNLYADISRQVHEVWVRARDTGNHTQPLDGSAHWNPSGYEWHAVDRVQINII